MRPIEIVTETKTSVIYKDKDVNDLLEEMCGVFHVILEECSRLKYKLEEGEDIDADDFGEIEAQCCEMLDYLED